MLEWLGGKCSNGKVAYWETLERHAGKDEVGARWHAGKEIFCIENGSQKRHLYG